MRFTAHLPLRFREYFRMFRQGILHDLDGRTVSACQKLRRQHLTRLAVGEKSAAPDEQEPGAEACGKRQLVRDEHDRLARRTKLAAEAEDFFLIDEELPGEGEDLYKTMGGFVTYGIGRIPKETDIYEWKNYKFEVIDMDNLRVDKILVFRAKTEEIIE